MILILIAILVLVVSKLRSEEDYRESSGESRKQLPTGVITMVIIGLVVVTGGAFALRSVGDLSQIKVEAPKINLGEAVRRSAAVLAVSGEEAKEPEWPKLTAAPRPTLAPVGSELVAVYSLGPDGKMHSVYEESKSLIESLGLTAEVVVVDDIAYRCINCDRASGFFRRFVELR